MTIKFSILAGIFALGLLSQTVQAKTATCLITEGASTTYKGKCDFRSEAGGTFSVSPIGKKTFDGERTTVSVYMLGNNTAQVRGLTTAGINAMWGDAVRSNTQKACWVGDDFKICAW